VATTRRRGEANVTSKRFNPIGPRTAPSIRKAATWGRPLRSINPERSAAIIITAPIRAIIVRNAAGLKDSMTSPFLFVDALFF
jgi:hypothetical protein